MSRRKPKFKTIKSCAEHLLLTVSYVDTFGRNVGYDYQQILTMLKHEFPNSATTMKELQKLAYSVGEYQRLPVRRRSRRILANDYTRTLVLRRDVTTGLGLSYKAISAMVRAKFPERPKPSICQISNHAGWATRMGVSLPERPDKKGK